MTAAELEVMKDIPGYKVLLKAVIKGQIQQLVEQLAVHTDEESVVLTASVADGTLSHLGSKSGKGFLDNNEDIKSQFLGYCLKNHHRQILQKDQPDNSSLSNSQRQTIPPVQTSKSPTHVSPQGKSSLVATPTRSSPRLRHEPYPVGRNSCRTSLNVEHGKRPVQTITLTSPIENESLVEIPEVMNQSVPEKETPEKKFNNQNETFQSEEKEVLKDKNAELCENSSKTIPNFLEGLDLDSGIKKQADEAESETDIQSELDSCVTVKVEAISESDMEMEITSVESLTSQANQRTEHSTDETWTHKTGESASGSEADEANRQLGNLELVSGQLVGEGIAPVRVHVCDICGKPFPSKWELGRHRRTHTGEKPYTCEYCSKAFSDKSNMNQHIKGVHFRKPFRRDR